MTLEEGYRIEKILPVQATLAVRKMSMGNDRFDQPPVLGNRCRFSRLKKYRINTIVSEVPELPFRHLRAVC